MSNDEYMPIEKYYALKDTFERLWGRNTYLDLKHCSDIRRWKRYCERTLRVSGMAAIDSVLIADDDWHVTFANIVQRGIERIKSAKNFDDLFQNFAATYMEMSFHQFGWMPSVSPSYRSKLKQGGWKLDGFRSVQYVQSPQQKANFERREQRLVEARQKLLEGEMTASDAGEAQTAGKAFKKVGSA